VNIELSEVLKDENERRWNLTGLSRLISAHVNLARHQLMTQLAGMRECITTDIADENKFSHSQLVKASLLDYTY
jgi:hypothetical protein